MPKSHWSRGFTLGLVLVTPSIAGCGGGEPLSADLPVGTELTVAVSFPLSSDATRAGDTFEARIANPVEVGNQIVVPSGCHVRGRILEAIPSRAVEGNGARLTLVLDAVALEDGEFQNIETAPVRLVGMQDSSPEALSAAASAATVVAQQTQDDEILVEAGRSLRFVTRRPIRLVIGSQTPSAGTH